MSSHLPPPLDKEAGEALPIAINASGDLHSFNLSGSVREHHRFNSRWLLEPQLRVDRGIWLNDAKSTPALPDRRGMVLNLPALDGEAAGADDRRDGFTQCAGRDGHRRRTAAGRCDVAHSGPDARRPAVARC